MKKILIFLFFTAFQASAQTIESHIFESVKPLGKVLEGKKGKVVLGTFKSAKPSDTCAPSRSVNSKVSAALVKAGVKTTVPHRMVDMNAEQEEISRVTKLSGGSYIVLGSYELVGSKFKIDCTLYDHNGAGIGACEDVASLALSEEMVKAIDCPVIPPPKEEKTDMKKEEGRVDDGPETGDSRLKKIDDYICSVIHKDYDLKRLVMSLYEKKFYTLEDLKGVKRASAEDALDVSKNYCVTLGNFVMCTDYWEGSGAQAFLGDATSLGGVKVLNWKHPSKAQVNNASRCLKKDDNWWNP